MIDFCDLKKSTLVKFTRVCTNVFVACVISCVTVFDAGAQQEVPPDFELPNIMELDPRAALSNIDDSEFVSLSNFEGFNPDHPTIIKVLFRLANLQPQIMESFAQPIDQTTISQLLEDPETFRTQVFSIKGNIKSIERHQMLPRTAEGFGFDHYYIYTLAIPSGENAKVVSQHKPASWQLGSGYDFPVSMNAYFLQVCNQRPNHELIFAADRIRWYPTEPNAELNIGNGQLILAAMNCDVADFDLVRSRHDLPIGDADGQVMLDWLAACTDLSPELVKQIQWKSLDLVDVLSNPTKRTGEAVELRGLARRISRVDSTDEEGNDLVYYQIDMFFNLDELEIDYTGRTRHTRKFRNSFPVTVCTKRLPEGVEPGTNLKIPLEIRGFYFKLWSFQTDQTKEISEENRQTNPLFVAASVSIDESAGSSWPISAFNFTVMGAALLLCGGMAVWHHLGRYRSALPQRKSGAVEAEQDVDLTALEAADRNEQANTT